MKIFKCDICNKEVDHVISCGLRFGVMYINDEEPSRSNTEMHRNQLCEECFTKAYKSLGYKAEQINEYRD